MTPADWIATAAAVFTGVCTIGGAVYMRGKLDAHAQSATESIKTLAAKFDEIEKARTAEAEARGAQGVRNELSAGLAEDVRKALDEGIRLGVKLEAHVESCTARQDAYEKRFDKLENRIGGGLDSLRAELKHIRTGDANRGQEVPATIARRAAQG